MTDNNEDVKTKRKVKVELRKAEDFKQIYAIGAVGGHSPYDFRIGFYNDTPKAFGNSPDSQVIQRTLESEVVMSPLAALELVRWLTHHIQEYEAMFGPITKPQAPRQKKETSPSQDSSELQGYM